MRVNVYSQEITPEVSIVRQRSMDTGVDHVGIRFFLHSSDTLHRTTKDDDRSAVTFWVNHTPSQMDAYHLAVIFEEAARKLRFSSK